MISTKTGATFLDCLACLRSRLYSFLLTHWYGCQLSRNWRTVPKILYLSGHSWSCNTLMMYMGTTLELRFQGGGRLMPGRIISWLLGTVSRSLKVEEDALYLYNTLVAFEMDILTWFPHLSLRQWWLQGIWTSLLRVYVYICLFVVLITSHLIYCCWVAAAILRPGEQSVDVTLEKMSVLAS